MESCENLSPLDGRYQNHCAELRGIFSEFGLIQRRVFVETQWLKFILRDLHFASVSEADLRIMESLAADFTPAQAAAVKDIEKTTNHDVKAVEYYLKDRLTAAGLGHLKEWVHFSCTSEDINNAAYALMLQSGRQILLDKLESLIAGVETLGRQYRSVPMLSRTHGQPATPTTVGKEFINFAWRLTLEKNILAGVKMAAKFNGATGNYNAHYFVRPDIAWSAAGEKFVRDSLGLEPLFWTTQINPYHSVSQLLHALIRIAAVLIDLDRDLWGYISLGYFKQKLTYGEVGSSTMPHKVNPIDFENSEGNLGLAISIMDHMAVKLLQSRFQRDLTDSTVLRNLGSVFGYLLLGFKSVLKGLGKIELNEAGVREDLRSHPELLAEPFQTAMRIYGETNPYERLKDLTRGATLAPGVWANFIDGLNNVPVEMKARMKNLTPETYIGLARHLVDEYFAKKGDCHAAIG
ncbi:MAG: adenylosuccinate lyase [Candidatus Omnitrophica bacterium]|nr:adenylosuccinate lyase [Candidatus Omnitrophota bacterium]